LRLFWTRIRLVGVVAIALAAVAACADESRPVERVGTIRAALAVAVQGTVRDAAGAPVADVTIELVDSSDEIAGSAVSDADGSYSLSVEQGTYDVVVTPPPESIFSPQTFPNRKIEADTKLDVVLVPTASANIVSGRLTDDEGRGLADQSVCLQGEQGACDQTDADGYYSLGVAPGDYHVSMSGDLRFGTDDEGGLGGAGGAAGAGGANGAAGSGFPTAYFYYSIWQDSLRTISSDTTLHLTLPTRTVSGEVRDADRQAVSGAEVRGDARSGECCDYQVSFDDFSGSIYWWGGEGTVTDSSGRFVLPILPGDGSLRITPDPDSGLSPFSIDNFTITTDLSLVVSVQFLIDSASDPAVPPDGEVTTDDEADGATPADPIETTVTTPDGGAVTIHESPITEEPPEGFSFLTQQVNITAPPATVSNPLVLLFTIDETRLPPGADENDVEIFRDGVLVPACQAPSAAEPDPCVASRGRLGDDVVITVLTTDASAWNVGIALPSDRDGDGTLDGYDGCPDDAGKVNPGSCGCGVPDSDSDGDGTLDCFDGCPHDAAKLTPGACGCGVADTDSDGDGTPDCNDACPTDPAKTAPGLCGCGVSDADTDGDGTPDCNDPCPTDPNDSCTGMNDGDGDGVEDSADGCEGTPPGEVVDPAGCSIHQLCPCDGPRGGDSGWKNHGRYVSCVTQAATAFRRAGLITPAARSAIVRSAARSDCGR
jgi:hypothetical protein